MRVCLSEASLQPFLKKVEQSCDELMAMSVRTALAAVDSEGLLVTKFGLPYDMKARARAPGN